MKPQAFIFIGRSGSGKGTQVEMLMEHLAKNDNGNGVLYVQTGKEFREFIKGDTETEKRAKQIYDEGGLMPEFLTVNMWVKPLIDKFKGNQHVIFDGTPRKVHEAGVLHSCFEFYGLGKPWVISLNVSAEESMKRLMARGRFDDIEKEIKKRLSWYESDVIPTIEFYRNNPAYNFIEIDGMGTPEEIHEDIVKKTGLR